MTLAQDNQSKSEVSSKILELLIELRDKHGMNWQEIGGRVGVAPSTISRVSTGKTTGGPQLLAGLELLKELTILKQSGVRVNLDLHRELEQMKRRLEEIQQQITTPYPEHRPQNLALNEETASSTRENDALAAVKAAQETKKTGDPHPK